MAGNNLDKIYQYTCSDPWNISSCSYDNINVSSIDYQPTGLSFNSLGTSLYISGSGYDKIYQYNCLTAWNLSSCSYYSNISVQTSQITGLFLNQYGNRLYESGYDPTDRTKRAVFQYNCTTAWNLSSCSYSGVNIPFQGASSYDVFFNPNETIMYEADIAYGENLIYQYTVTDTVGPAPVDSTDPAVTINSPTNTTYTTATVTMNVTATDASSSVSSCWYTIDSGTTNYTLTNSAGDYYSASRASLANQLYTARFYCNDTSNNINNTESVSFTVSVAAAATTSSGGGGGGGTTVQPTTSLAFPSVLSRTPITSTVSLPGIDLTKMTITTNQDLTDASITITAVNVLPQSDAQSGLPEGTSYQAFNIDIIAFDDSNIDSVILEFKVDKSWITDQGGTFDQVSLFKRSSQETPWGQLPTTYSSEDDNYYYFNATFSGFSEFTVFLVKGSEFYCSNPGERRCNGNLTQLCLANKEWRNIRQCNLGCVEGECLQEPLLVRINDLFSKITSTTPGLIALVVLIFLVSLSVIVVFYLLIQQKTSSKKLKKVFRSYK